MAIAINIGSPMRVLEAARSDHVRRLRCAPKMFIVHPETLANLAEALNLEGRQLEAAQALGLFGVRTLIGVPVELDSSPGYPRMLCSDGTSECL